MEAKLAQRIKKLLGSEYFLCDKLDMETLEEDWVLYKLDYKEAIMTSKDTTDKELLAYAKAHHKWDLEHTVLGVSLIICSIALVLLLLNIFIFNNDMLRSAILAMQLVALIFNFTVSKVGSHNFKVYMLDFEEKMKIMKEEIELENKERGL